MPERLGNRKNFRVTTFVKSDGTQFARAFIEGDEKTSYSNADVIIETFNTFDDAYFYIRSVNDDNQID